MMKIQEMVDYLHKKGFIADKTWDAMKSSYKFTIKRGDRVLTRYYRFTPNANPLNIEIYQKEFLDNIIKEFEELKREQNMNNNNTMFKYENAIGWDHFGRKIDFSGEGVQYLDTDSVYTEYCKADVENTRVLYKQALNSFYGVSAFRSSFKIKKVIFNDPATIVMWTDGTKTVVKTQNGEIFDPEKGLAMAITKKALGNKGNYFNTIKKWTGEHEATIPEFDVRMDFISRRDAEEVLCQMEELIKTYGVVTVGDLYDLTGNDGPYRVIKYGWTDLKDARVRKVKNKHYTIDFPKYLPLG